MTSMMLQYLDIKKQYKDFILFYRLGDFYEMFFDDAILASRELELTLTGRDCGEPERAPMCGVPYHLSAGFIGAKAPETDAPYFGVHCAYLVWYAWNHFGYDLDSDGGRLVTASDLLHSDLLEVVQLYGMAPQEFIE